MKSFKDVYELGLLKVENTLGRKLIKKKVDHFKINKQNEL